MITIFCTPKDFIGEFSIIQKNALFSWRSISNDIEILIMGNSDGTREISKEVNGIHVEDIEYSNENVPLVSSLFSNAQRIAKYDSICYLNSDIIISDEIFNAFSTIKNKFSRYLGIAYRYNINCKKQYNFLHFLFFPAKHQHIFFVHTCKKLKYYF